MSENHGWEDHYSNIAKARKEGFEVIFGNDETLLLDIDTEAGMEQYTELKGWFEARFGKERERWQSKSGNTHIVLTLRQPMSLELRIAMQVILGSDPKRGFCEVQQVIEKPNPIALFKPKKVL